MKRTVLVLVVLPLALTLTGAAAPEGCGGPAPCVYEGRFVESGQTFGAPEGCGSCSCERGRVSCTAIGCPTAKGSCAVGGKIHKHGAGFPSADGCNTCTCNDGKVACTEKACTTTCGGVAGKTCPKGLTCVFKAGQCGWSDQMGVCEKLPSACNKQYTPVCGCDGKTYGNACMAKLSGVSINHTGRCVAKGDCRHGGKVYKDGQTFPARDGCNTCTCSSGRVICTDKACRATCDGIAGKICPKGLTCIYQAGRCDWADQMGICEKLPSACSKQYTPVCGCDGKTYGNACMAKLAGISINHSGQRVAKGDCLHGGKVYRDGQSFPAADGCNTCSCSSGRVLCTEKKCRPTCGGIVGKACPKGLTCFFKAGQCGWADQLGVCEARPSACDQRYNPVCGCDGKTYSNACSAAAAGFSVRSSGGC